mgnify:CR=1 FL=1
MRTTTSFEYKSGDVVFFETPLLAIQTLVSRKYSLCCGVCFSYIGDWKVQRDLLLGSSRTTCRKEAILKESGYGCINQQCEEIFCSLACQQVSYSNGHLLECGGVCCCCIPEDGGTTDASMDGETLEFSCDPVEVRHVVSAAKGFYKHSITTNELYLASRRVITTLLSSLLFPISSSHQTPHGECVKSVTVEQTTALMKAFQQHFTVPRLWETLNSDVNVENLHTQNKTEKVKEVLVEMEEPADDHNNSSDSHHESWLLLYTSLMATGLVFPSVAPLLSFSFYTHIVKVLSIHLKSIRVHDPPLLSFLLGICITGNHEEGHANTNTNTNTNTQNTNTEGEQESETQGGGRQRNTSDATETKASETQRMYLLYQKLFQDTEDREGISLTRLAQLMTASGMERATDTHTLSASEYIEKGACVCMTLLPTCSAVTQHSCLPNAHFAPVPVGTAVRTHSGEDRHTHREPDATTGLYTDPDSYKVELPSQYKLPSSSLLRVQVEAIRDFIGHVSIPRGVDVSVDLGGCRKAIAKTGTIFSEPVSVAIIPYILHPYATREAHLQTLLKPLLALDHSSNTSNGEGHDIARCACPRCLWEDNPPHTTVTPTTRRGMWLQDMSPRVQLALANHYMQEGEKGGGADSYLEAIQLYVLIIAQQERKEEEEEEEGKDKRGLVLAMAYHAWGAAHLNLGMNREGCGFDVYL